MFTRVAKQGFSGCGRSVLTCLKGLLHSGSSFKVFTGWNHNDLQYDKWIIIAMKQTVLHLKFWSEEEHEVGSGLKQRAKRNTMRMMKAPMCNKQCDILLCAVLPCAELFPGSSFKPWYSGFYSLRTSWLLFDFFFFHFFPLHSNRDLLFQRKTGQLLLSLLIRTSPHCTYP